MGVDARRGARRGAPARRGAETASGPSGRGTVAGRLVLARHQHLPDVAEDPPLRMTCLGMDAPPGLRRTRAALNGARPMRCTVSTKRSSACGARGRSRRGPRSTPGISAAANDGPITSPSVASMPCSPPIETWYHSAPVLVDAEDADVADVVVAAGVHAARDVQVQLADVVQVVEVVEAALDRLGDRDRLGVGERAEVAARAADDVGEEPHVGRGEAGLAGAPPQGEQVALAHVGEDQVLLVRRRAARRS